MELNNLREKADFIEIKSLMNKVHYENTTRMEKNYRVETSRKTLKKFAKLIEHTSYFKLR